MASTSFHSSIWPSGAGSLRPTCMTMGRHAICGYTSPGSAEARSTVRSAAPGLSRRETRAVQGVDVLGEGLEAPGDAGLERLDRHAFDVLEQSHDDVAVLRQRRRDTEAAVAHHDARDAVPARRGQVAVPEDLRVVVRVDVD